MLSICYGFRQRQQSPPKTPPGIHELSPKHKEVHKESQLSYAYPDYPGAGYLGPTERYVNHVGSAGHPIKRSGSALLETLYPDLRTKVESCLLDPSSVTLGPQVGKGQLHSFICSSSKSLSNRKNLSEKVVSRHFNQTENQKIKKMQIYPLHSVFNRLQFYRSVWNGIQWRSRGQQQQHYRKGCSKGTQTPGYVENK